MQSNDAKFLVLSALADGPLHGYAVNTAIATRTGRRLGPGSLYGALSRLREQGLIEPAGNLGRQQRMRLTADGRDALADELRALSQVFETVVPDSAAYLDRAAASSAGRSYKPLLLAALALDSGCTVVDLGCGTGVDLAEMAAVAATVVGVDADPAMVDAATRRLADVPNADVVTGDVHALPFASGSVDRVRTDRVLQHVADPRRVLAEARRVLRPGGRLVMGEPDWETLVVDHPEPELARAYTRFVTDEAVRNGRIGRSLPRLAEAAGFEVPQVFPVTPVFRDLAAADEILGFERIAGRAVTAGHLTRSQADRLLRHLAVGPLLVTVTQFLVVATVPRD